MDEPRCLCVVGAPTVPGGGARTVFESLFCHLELGEHDRVDERRFLRFGRWKGRGDDVLFAVQPPPDFSPAEFPGEWRHALCLSDAVLWCISPLDPLSPTGEHVTRTARGVAELCVSRNMCALPCVSAVDQLLFPPSSGLDSSTVYDRLLDTLCGVSRAWTDAGGRVRDAMTPFGDPSVPEFAADAVLFVSADAQWGFSLDTFAELYHRSPSTVFPSDWSVAQIREKLWGEHFFDGSEWTTTTFTKGPRHRRGFEQLVVRPLRQLRQACEHGQEERLSSLLQRLDIPAPNVGAEPRVSPQALFERLVQMWLPLDRLLGSVARRHVAPPSRRWGAERNSEGTLPELCLFVGPTLTTREGFDVCLTRVLGGELSADQPDVVENMAHRHIEPQQLLRVRGGTCSLRFGATCDPCEIARCGELVAVQARKLAPGEVHPATLFDVDEHIYDILPEAFEVEKFTVAPTRLADEGKLVQFTNVLKLADPSVAITDNLGRIVVSTSSRAHSARVRDELASLRSMELVITDIPVVRETTSCPSRPILVKSPNKHKRVVLESIPVDPVLCDVLLRNRIVDGREFQRSHPDHFRDGERVMAVAGTNLLVDCTQSRSRTPGLLHPVPGDVWDYMISGFTWTIREGVLTESPVSGYRLDVLYYHDGSSSVFTSGAGQVIPTLRRGGLAGQRLGDPVLTSPRSTVECAVQISELPYFFESVKENGGVLRSQFFHELSNMTIVELDIAPGHAADLAAAHATIERADWVPLSSPEQERVVRELRDMASLGDVHDLDRLEDTARESEWMERMFSDTLRKREELAGIVKSARKR
jgi:translation elongation factor EF-G